MPTSSADGKDWAAARIRDIAPKSVVDIGPGEGTYGRICRDVANPRYMIAVEIWGPYVETYGLASLYDRVIIADVRHLNFSSIAPASLIILGDVLEHMDKSDAVGVVQDCMTWGFDHILVSTPVLHCLFEGPNGNPFDGHKAGNLWEESEMDAQLEWLATLDGYTVEKHVGPVLGYWLLIREGVVANYLYVDGAGSVVLAGDNNGIIETRVCA